MASPFHELLAASVRMVAEIGGEALRVECTRLARLIRARGWRTVGLVAAGKRAAIPAVALQLARAQAEVTGAPVAVVNAAGTWPRTLFEHEHADELAAPFTLSWILEDLALLAPRHGDVGAVIVHLAELLRGPPETVGAILVNLTGLERLGAHAEAFTLVDGIIVVARSGDTTERNLQQCIRDVPPEKCLGVLLAGCA